MRTNFRKEYHTSNAEWRIQVQLESTSHKNIEITHYEEDLILSSGQFVQKTMGSDS